MRKIRVIMLSLVVIVFLSLIPTNAVNASTGAKWHKNKQGWWYSTADGSYYKNCWKQIKGNWYYFKSDGYMAHDEFIKGYYVNSDGKWDGNAKYSWIKKNGSWYYINKNKQPFTKDMEDLEYYCFAKIDNKVYCFSKNGVMWTNVYIGNNDFPNNYCGLNLPSGFSWIGKNGKITYKGILKVTNNKDSERYIQKGDTYKDTLGWTPKNTIYTFIDTTYGGCFNVSFDNKGVVTKVTLSQIDEK